MFKDYIYKAALKFMIQLSICVSLFIIVLLISIFQSKKMTYNAGEESDLNKKSLEAAKSLQEEQQLAEAEELYSRIFIRIIKFCLGLGFK